MGSNSSSLRKSLYLKKEEIDKIVSKNKMNIIQVYKKLKNADGLLTTNELNIITYNLIDIKIRKKIIQICGSKSDKLNFDDLCYLYSLLNTVKLEAKLKFLLDFIFIKKNKLPRDKYIHKVIKYFKGSDFLQKIFLEQNIISKEKIDLDGVYNYVINTYSQNLNNYSLYISPYEITQNNEIDENDDINSKNILLLHSKTSIFKSGENDKKKKNLLNNLNTGVFPNSKLSTKFENLKGEFEDYEKANNGVFSINLFEEMLNEINVNPIIIKIIINYITLKSKKTILNFNIFKEIMILLSQNNSNNDIKKVKQNLISGFFTIYSYPNDYISKTALTSLIKESGLESNQIEKKIDKIKKNITREKFIEISDVIMKDLIESLEHINYFRYIFFKTKLDDYLLQKNCIELLLKGNKLNDYIIERMQYDTQFYIIDKDFYIKWTEYVKLNEYEQRRFNINNLRMNTNKISDKNGRILENKQFDIDYIVVSKRIYNLFCNWYHQPNGGEIMREKIYLDDFDKNKNISKSTKNKKKKNSGNTIFKGIDIQTQQRYELELYPIFILFYFFSDLIKKNGSMSSIKEELKKNMNNKNNSFYPFSRKSKFDILLKRLEESLDFKLDKNYSRLWLFYNDKFDIVNLDETLEQKNVISDAIVVLEIKEKNYWPSYKLKKEGKVNDKKSITYSGLINIGNTCYMNSVLQIFLNIQKLKDIFLKKDEKEKKLFMGFITNPNKQKNNNNLLIYEFINLLKEKWLEEKKEITPKKFKEICGEYNDTFKGYEQQDAHDFYTFLLDSLHEDTNIKSNFIKVEENEEITEQTNENELANEYWANNVRNNASYFYALFMGQLKSTLTCSECKKSKIKYEPFNSLELPIPEAKKIILEITLYRLPYRLKPMIKNNFGKNDNFDKKAKKKKTEDMSIFSIKSKNKTDNTDSIINVNPSIQDTNKSSKNDKDELISNTLNFNIPLKLKIEINRKEKCSKIIEHLKSLSELNLEQTDIYSEFVILSGDNYIELDMIIDDTFLNNEKISIYELLNNKGIKYIFNYTDIIQSNTILLQEQKLEILNNQNNNIKNKKINKLKRLQTQKKKNKNSNLKIMDFNFILPKEISNYNSYEILVPIIHRYSKEINKGFISIEKFQYIHETIDVIIMSSKDSIKSINLYEIMWEKYMYFLNSPSKFESICWWKKSTKEIIKSNTLNLNIKTDYKNKEKDKSSYYSPFKIKIIDKNTYACSFCPWFRFCTGCILDPNITTYLNFTRDSIIVIEWDKDIVNNEMNKNNINLILNHSSYKNFIETTNGNIEKISINDCLKLFTRKEELNDIFCEKCNKKTLFTKSLDIERIPKYLVIVLKRFKYTLMHMDKIEYLINFPTEHLNLKDYTSQKKLTQNYDLYGIINHIGTITGGHYYSIIKPKNTWMRFDDSYVYENESNVETNNAYVLIYQMTDKEKINKKEFYFNYLGLMDTAYKIYIQQNKFENLFNYILDGKGNIINAFLDNCQFYFGEPVNVGGKYGYLMQMNKIEGKQEVNVRIKFKDGYFISTLPIEQIIKETVKSNSSIKNLIPNEVEKKDSVCAHCGIF